MKSIRQIRVEEAQEALQGIRGITSTLLNWDEAGNPLMGTLPCAGELVTAIDILASVVDRNIVLLVEAENR